MIPLSVVIPTYNKKEILKMALDSLGKQTFLANKFEVIIVDDGSTDGTFAEIKKLLPRFKFKGTIVSQKNKGPASARNKGITEAQGKIILIINDDTIASPDLLRKHFIFHQKNPQEYMGLLGYFTWHPDLLMTPFMYWLEHGGPYFSFSEIQVKEAGWERLWTCNISFKKKFLMENGLFDESFPYAAWEDVELGYRLGKSGFKLFYDKKAIGYHYHPTTIKSIKTKMKNNGFSTLLLKDKIPSEYLPPLGRNPRLFTLFDNVVFNPIVYFLLENACLFFEYRLNLAILFDLLLLHYRILGVKVGFRYTDDHTRFSE